RGQRVTELMKQMQYEPMSIAQMAVSLYAANQGFLDDVDVDKVVDFEAALQGYMKSEQTDLLEKINSSGDFNDEIDSALRAALEQFKASNTW
ncbi:MAG: F0F1 ATP synthase subunit alpha, partial [Pseudomonadota bacterium]